MTEALQQFMILIKLPGNITDKLYESYVLSKTI